MYILFLYLCYFLIVMLLLLLARIDSSPLPLTREAFILKTISRILFLVTSATLIVDTKNCEIKEKDSAQNNCKPLQTVWSIALEMGPRSLSPGCRTLKQR